MKLIRQIEVYAPEYLGKKDVLICGGKTEWIRDEIRMEDEACEVIDGTGKMLVPGLIDQHVHITGGGGEGSFHTKAPEVNLSALVRGGITTVVGLLGTDGISRNVENLLSKAKALKEEGISCYICTGSYGYPSVTITGDVKKDIAFIDEVLGVKLAISDHRAPNITVDILISLASDVRTAAMLSGKPGIVTLHMGDDKRGLKPVFEALERTSIPIKTFRPTHVSRNPQLLEQAFAYAKMGGYIDITAGQTGTSAVECIRAARELHVPFENITFSSDGQGSWSNYDKEGHLLEIGVSSVSSLYEELVHLVQEGGLSLSEALPFMTSQVAAALELGQKGQIREGADADLVILNQDMTMDSVLAMGRLMMEHGQVKVWGTYESRDL
ncbi:MAG: beta-aspartyl-peptidase [Lachnospiraceae bacterium]|nr:beta-aspartyl-peptidase [Lachnospiraceae bacterium]